MLQRERIPIIKARAGGQQFVVYGDSCSGLAGAAHEEMFRQINRALDSLEAAPQFICFLGDEIVGLTRLRGELEGQWRHFFERELAWLDRERIPLYHTTGNHTVYDRMSEAVFRQVMAHLPQNGPPDQIGLSCFVRRGDLLMIFVNTMWMDGGGEGVVETEWLEGVLRQGADARHKLVFGHHPAWPVNGYCGDYQRTIERGNSLRFWDVLRRHDVLAYFCSHILAFDVQLQGGIAQICTAGAGTAHRMPPEQEYLHFVQAALDSDGLRYQVLDRAGRMREWLRLNWPLPPSSRWQPFEQRLARSLPGDCLRQPDTAYLIVWEISGRLLPEAGNQPQTFVSASAESGGLPNLWLGASGVDKRLSVILSPEPHRSPHRWRGPALPPGGRFRIQVALHSGMGPGGLLWRWDDAQPWSTMANASAWGLERVPWSHAWQIGASGGEDEFRGRDLQIRWHHQVFALSDYL